MSFWHPSPLLFLVLATACGPVDYANYPPRHSGVWVAFGDSLTYGTGAADGQDYPTQLGEQLGIEIVNAGVPGQATADGLAQIDRILAFDPAVVLLCLGGNDGLQNLPLDETLGNLSAIITRLQAQGVFVVLIGVRSSGLMDRYAGPFAELASKKQTLYVPNILDGVLGKRAMMSDRIHPNTTGYEVIAMRLAKELREAGVVP